MTNDKELFLWKQQKETLEEWDNRCSKKAEGFPEARSEGDFETCFHKLCRNMDIKPDENRFVYFFDFDFRFSTSIENIAPDYSKIVNQGINALYYEESDCTNEFCRRYNSIVDDLMLLADRIIECLEKQLTDTGTTAGKDAKTVKKQIQWFENMKANRAESFEEALQRILFLNQLIWQTGSRLVGLGRLDMLLYPYYETDMARGTLTKEQAKQLIKDFLKILHGHYWFKSTKHLGDTGQVIILGGSDTAGNYTENELTYLFLESVKECQLSEPKIVLRTNARMPRKLMEEAVRCMQTGIGSPLLSNDDVIIPKLTAFGIEKEDAYAYTTSACWEPLIGGKSSSMNNQYLLIYIRALNTLLREEPLKHLDSFENLKEQFRIYLRREVIKCEKGIYAQVLRRNTLYSVFITGCKENKKDIVEGGAVYHNVGMTTAGLGNVVNALLNIKKHVYEEHTYSLVDVKKMCLFGYEEYPEAENLLLTENKKFGQDDEEVIALSNEIQQYVSSLTENFRTPVGGKLKFGISSPSYLTAGSIVGASFDGRRAGEPLIVHISNESAASYTELINFAAALDYGDNRFNGNVLDFMVSPSFLEHHFDKFVTLLMRGNEVGYFQLQTNVISSDTLKEAKRSPEKFPNLIVRVWGFSAYFVELPENYQDLLIQRALRNEGKTA